MPYQKFHMCLHVIMSTDMMILRFSCSVWVKCALAPTRWQLISFQETHRTTMSEELLKEEPVPMVSGIVPLKLLFDTSLWFTPTKCRQKFPPAQLRSFLSNVKRSQYTLMINQKPLTGLEDCWGCRFHWGVFHLADCCRKLWDKN